MTLHSTAIIHTASASRYLQQLCKHWSHNLEVAFTPEEGTITFPREMRGTTYPTEGVVRMKAQPEILEVTVEGGDQAHIDRLKQVAASHLDRFAFREAPLPFAWVDAA